MSNVVVGRLCTLSVYITDGYYPVLCATDMTLTVRQETVLKTGPNSGLWRERMGRLSEWSGSCTGLTNITGSPTSWFYLLQESVRQKTQDWLYTFVDDAGNSKQIQGYALITLNEINGPATDFSTASIQFEGTGALTFDPIVPVVGNFRLWSDYWTTTNGLNYISGASAGVSPAAIENGTAFTLATGDTVLEIDVEGIEYDVVTGSPSTGREAQPAVSSGRVNFLNNFDGTQRVFVLFRRPL